MKLIDGWVDTAEEFELKDLFWPRNGMVPTHVVLHGTAGGSDGEGTLKYEASVGVSTHFAISTNGAIWQGVSTDNAAWGNAPLMAPRLNFKNATTNPNLWTISVEFCKPDSTNVIAITPQQFASGVQLVALLCDFYKIPKKRGDGVSGIIGHCDLNSIDRAMCPGTFDWDGFINNVNGGSEVNQADYDALYKKYTTVTTEYNKVVTEKNSLIDLNNASKATLVTIQGKLTTLQDAYNVVVGKKNAQVTIIDQLNAEIAKLEAQPGSDVVALQQQITTLKNKISQAVTSLQA